MNLIKPKFWDENRFSLIALLLLPFSYLVNITNHFKQNKYKYVSKIKSICVGNIYIGGTGKTPLSLKINQILSKKFKTVIIKKFYSNQKDEIKLLNKYGKLISEKKRESAIKIAEKKYELAIFDDGLQDSSLRYDISIACFNSSIGFGNKLLIPAGPLREKISRLKKYDAVFLNGEKNILLEKEIKKINKKINIFRGIYILKNKKKLNKNRSNIIFSGIGNPKEFENLLSKNKIKFNQSLRFADHHQYSKKEILNIKNISKRKNLGIITTEKDYMRIPNKLKKNINVAMIEIKIVNEKSFVKFVLDRL